LLIGLFQTGFTLSGLLLTLFVRPAHLPSALQSLVSFRSQEGCAVGYWPDCVLLTLFALLIRAPALTRNDPTHLPAGGLRGRLLARLCITYPTVYYSRYSYYSLGRRRPRAHAQRNDPLVYRLLCSRVSPTVYYLRYSYYFLGCRQPRAHAQRPVHLPSALQPG